MPIDIASGTAKLDFEDILIPGHVPLVWDRNYSTSLLTRPSSALGRGWTSRYFATLTYRESEFEFFTPEGNLEVIPNPDNQFARGELLQDFGAFLEVFREGGTAVVRTWDIETGAIWRYVFTPGAAGKPWPLAAIEDVTSHQGVDLTWDSISGHLLLAQQRLERRALVPSYDKKGRICRIELRAADGENHVITKYTYDDGLLSEVENAAGFADRFEYDVQGRIVREIVKDGGVFHYRYDLLGRCVLRTGLAHYNEKRLRFIDGIHTTEVTNSYGEKTVYQHLPTGQAVSIVDPLGGQRTTEYDKYGRIIAETGATGGIASYTYDAHGNRNSITNALGQITQFHFNEDHQALSMTDAAGSVWKRNYDEYGRLITSIDPLGGHWQLAYDAEGNVTKVINPKGDRKQMHFQKGILLSGTDWMNHATQFRFDGFGRVVERTGPLGQRTTFRYDVMGNPVVVHLPDDTALTATYNYSGSLTRFVDAMGNTTRWRYGPCARLMERTDPVGGTVSYVWGSEPGRIEVVINEKGERYSYERDEAGRIVREVSFDGALRQFNLNAEGHTTAYTNANEETIIQKRDLQHRVVCQHLPNGEQVEYAFDPLGQLITAINSDIKITIQRDVLGHITREDQGEEWVTSRYDEVGNLIEMRTSQGHESKYEYDANGRMSALVTAGGKRMSFERDANGNEVERQMFSGARLSQSFDVMGRLIGQRLDATVSSITGMTDGMRRNYTYDHSGALTRIVDGRWGQVDYSYDPAEHLLSSIRQRGTSGVGDSNEQFDYDLTGNITHIRAHGVRTVNGNAQSDTNDEFEYAAGNRLICKGNTRYEYDAEGRRIRKIEYANTNTPKVWTFEWNSLNRLCKLTRPDGEVWRYRYDALGRRVSKELIVKTLDTLPSAELNKPTPRYERFVWNQDVVVHQLKEAQEAVTWLFEATTFAPIAKVVNQEVQAIVNDHLGTPREIINETGQIVLLSIGGAWEGGTRVDLCPIGFQGQWKDTESGLACHRFRFYDLNTGCFISQDPIGLAGGENLYRYVPNPINWYDPLGLACNPENATHITYEGIKMKDGKPMPYIGYASKPGLGHSAQDVLKYRYPDTSHFVVKPEPFYVGNGQKGKNTARGLEQRTFEQRGGLEGTSNKQNPVGLGNDNREAYLKAADNHLAGLSG